MCLLCVKSPRRVLISARVAARRERTTVCTPGPLVDTQLFLFRFPGAGVVANDDSKGTLRSTFEGIPVQAGLYFLGVSAGRAHIPSRSISRRRLSPRRSCSSELPWPVWPGPGSGSSARKDYAHRFAAGEGRLCPDSGADRPTSSAIRVLDTDGLRCRAQLGFLACAGV
jgi:hypothetical protein